MKRTVSKFGKYFLSIALLLGVSKPIFAQTDIFSLRDLSSIRIESLSDDDLRNLKQKAVSAGYTETELIGLARERGLPISELSSLRQRLQAINGTPGRNLASMEGENEMKPKKKFDSTEGTIVKTHFSYDESIFGSELFSSASTAFEPNLRIPAPPSYVLGPDDEIVISVYGFSENKYSLTVDEQGEIYIHNVGPIVVSGLTLEDATDKIKSKLASTIYSAIRTGQTKVQVTLGKIKSIRVTVIGQAKKTGTYTVSSLTTLYNLLYLCGGPTDMGSYRDIEIIRRNEKRSADLYDFLVYGNQKDNVLLKEGDVIRIPYYKQRVWLSGQVKRGGKYEMLPGETFKNVLVYSGGFTDNAYRGEVSIERITDSVRQVIDLRADSFSTFLTKGSDRYFVKQLGNEFANRLFISGAIQRPGPYELSSDITMLQLIEKAGGLTPEAYRTRALIYRSFANKMPTIESVNLDSILSGDSNMKLRKNDSVVIASLFEFMDDEKVVIKGNVRNPIEVRWREGMTLKDVLFMAGGINDSGDSSRVEVSRRISNAEVEFSNYLESEVFTVDLKNPSLSDILLSPYDIILVKEKPGYTVQRTVIVSGAVMSPGPYILEKSGSTISEIITRAGGFKASADSNSLTIRRLKAGVFNPEERQHVLDRILSIDNDSIHQNQALRTDLNSSYDILSVNLKRILTSPESDENLQLEDGDVLIVERSANLVRVSGEVYFPTIVAYKPNKNLKYYVEQAGNFMPRARKSGALVIHPNGTVESVRAFLFFKRYPIITPRSEIFVPAKEKSNRAKLGATEWAIILSAMGIVSNVVINLTK